MTERRKVTRLPPNAPLLSLPWLINRISFLNSAYMVLEGQANSVQPSEREQYDTGLLHLSEAVGCFENVQGAMERLAYLEELEQKEEQK